MELIQTPELTPPLRVAARRMLDRAFGPDSTETGWEHALDGVHVVAVAGGVEVVSHAAVEERALEG